MSTPVTATWDTLDNQARATVEDNFNFAFKLVSDHVGADAALEDPRLLLAVFAECGAQQRLTADVVIAQQALV